MQNLPIWKPVGAALPEDRGNCPILLTKEQMEREAKISLKKMLICKMFSLFLSYTDLQSQIVGQHCKMVRKDRPGVAKEMQTLHVTALHAKSWDLHFAC